MHTKLFETDKIVPFCLPNDIANYGLAVKYAAQLTEEAIEHLKETNESDKELLTKIMTTAYYLYELLDVIAQADMAYQGKPMSKEGRLHLWGKLQGFKRELIKDIEVGN